MRFAAYLNQIGLFEFDRILFDNFLIIILIGKLITEAIMIFGSPLNE